MIMSSSVYSQPMIILLLVLNKIIEMHKSITNPFTT